MSRSVLFFSVRFVSRVAIFAALVFCLTCLAVADPSSYVVKDLGVLSGDTSSNAMGINKYGDVVGWSFGPAGTRAFVYTDVSGMIALPGLLDRSRTIARDINDIGDVVGTANAGGTDLGHAVLWTNGSIVDLGTLGTGSFSDGWGINNFRQVVGSSYTNGGSGLSGVHAFLYSENDGMIDLTPDNDTGFAGDINDAGQVTGYMSASLGNYHTFRWQAGEFTDLGVLPGFAHSFGWAINAAGQVAGNSTSASGNSEQLFRSVFGGGLQNLGGAGEHNTAWGINASGDVVGTQGASQGRALLYTNSGGLQDLNTLIDPSLGWVLLAAYDINDAGQIVGTALNNFTGQTHAVRLEPSVAPVPECSSHCLRSTKIGFGTKTTTNSATVTAKVKVKDENGHSMSNAMVVGIWTQPNGSPIYYYAWTNSHGVAKLATTGPRRGTYSFQVANIVLSLYTFNPSQSVLTRSITVN